ncbi:hypothetical protein [Desulfobacula sp.]|jgi:hypothetical protein
MTKQTNTKKDLTKKKLIKILEKIDSERINQNLKEDSIAKKKLKN